MLNRFGLPLRPFLTIAVWSGLYGACRGLMTFLRLFLWQDSNEALLPALARNLEVGSLLLPAGGWALLGVVFAAIVSVVLARSQSRPASEILPEIARPFVTLLVPVALTVSCVLSLLWSPSFPYGVNLALTLALEGPFYALLSAGLFLASLARTVVVRAGPLGSPFYRWLRKHRLEGAAVVVLSLICFAVATPARFYDDGAGQGNMFKYLRMASAVAGSGTLDIERARENPSPTLGAFSSRLPGVATNYVGEAVTLMKRIIASAARGQLYTGELTARRANRSMFRSEEGGIYYINAPGPGLLLVPAYLMDRALNRFLDRDRQVAVILFWHLIGALLVYEIILSTRDAVGEAAAFLTALAVALAVPFLFYTFQVYPELPGGLLLLFAFRKLVLDPAPTGKAVFAASMALAGLPWLHQKYSVASAVLALLAVRKLWKRVPGGVEHHPVKLALLAAPLALSAFSVFLYNHALTGSLSPTATFTAAGRSSFEPHNFVKGFLGLLFDRENGLFVFAPLYLLALVGAHAFAARERRILLPFGLVLASYLFVIASFPYWPGAVSTMGRYILSILPLAALPMAIVVRRATEDGVVAGATVTLAAGSFAFSVSFANDLIPSYQPLLLWGRTLFSDPMQYFPSFLSEGFLGSGDAHFVKLLAELLAVALLVYWLRDRIPKTVRYPVAENDDFARRASGSALCVVGGILLFGAVLEHWPGNASSSSRPAYRDTLSLPKGRTLAVRGEHGFEGPGVWVPGGGTSRFLMLSSRPLREVTLLLTNGPRANTVRLRERRGTTLELELPEGGPHVRTLRLRNPYHFSGSNGDRFVYELDISSSEAFVPSAEGTGEDSRRLGVYVRVR